MTIKVAYLVNQYPKVSHSFVRREIVGVEACGIEVFRYSIRTCESELVDEADKAELGKTKVVLKNGIKQLLVNLIQVALTKPLAFWKTFKLAYSVGLHSDRGLLLHIIYLAEACLLLGWLTKDGIDHIHAHFGTNSTTVAMFCNSLGGPTYSFTVHGPEEFDKATVLGLEEKIRRSTFVVAISSFGKSQLYRWCQHDQWSKIQIVRCGVDANFLSQPQIPIQDSVNLVCVGRLSEQKGHLLLTEAAKCLAQEKISFKLVLVGDGPLRHPIEKQITENNLKDFIHITGWASSQEVRDHLLAARVLVLPSFAEGLPVVIMEALALGRPVISTYVAGIPELVEPNVCGWLVPAGSTQDLVKAMKQALTLSPDHLNKMGKAGIDRIVEFHDAAKEATHLAALFKQVVNSPN